jgi:hypothetical protein
LDLCKKGFYLGCDLFGDVRGHSTKDFRSHVGERFTEVGEILGVSLPNVCEGGGMGFSIDSQLIRDGIPSGFCGGGVLERLLLGGGFRCESGF